MTRFEAYQKARKEYLKRCERESKGYAFEAASRSFNKINMKKHVSQKCD